MAVAVEKAAAALRVTADVAKLQAELQKLNEEVLKVRRENLMAPKRERSERLRDYVALLTPVITIVTLAATLIAQNWQFLTSEAAKREAALDAQWQEAIKTISASGSLAPGVVALQPYLRSPKYGEQARDVAVNLLSNSTDPVFFSNLFGSALGSVEWTNFGRLVQLSRALHTRTSPLWAKSWNPKTLKNDLKRLDPKELALFQYTDSAMPALTSQMGSLLKTTRPDGAAIDLSATHFRMGDWSGANLRGASIEGARITYINLAGADLGGIKSFAGADFYRTAWWEAKSMSRELFDHLRAAHPYEASTPYGPRDALVARPDYQAALVRLEAQLD